MANPNLTEAGHPRWPAARVPRNPSHGELPRQTGGSAKQGAREKAEGARRQESEFRRQRAAGRRQPPSSRHVATMARQGGRKRQGVRRQKTGARRPIPGPCDIHGATTPWRGLAEQIARSRPGTQPRVGGRAGFEVFSTLLDGDWPQYASFKARKCPRAPTIAQQACREPEKHSPPPHWGRGR
jgi:hypothetical protein